MSMSFMNKSLIRKIIVIAIFLGISITLNAQAAVISFYVVETGLPFNAPANQNSMQWENAFFDVFFDSGYIASNYPMMRHPVKPEGSIIEASGYDEWEAKDAGVEYILVTQLDYENALLPPGIITFYIFRVDNHQVIYEKQINGLKGKSERESYENMKVIIKDLVLFVYNLR